jgi:integrase
LDGEVYRFSFNGKKGMPLITKKPEAKEHEVVLKRQIRAGTYIEDSPVQNFAQFYAEVFMAYSKRHKSEKAQMFDEYYGTHLLEEFGKRRLSQITPGMIERFLCKLASKKTQYDRKFSPVTIRMIYSRLNQVFSLAARERVFMENPCRLVNPAILKEFPSWQPRKRFLNKYAEDEEVRLFGELDGKLQTICRLLLNTGLRPPQEIMKVEKAHVNLTAKPMHYKFTERDGEHLMGKHTIVPPHALMVVHGKNGTTRIVPLNSIAYSILEVLCADVATGDFLFLNREGSQQESIKKGFAAACERAGIENLRPYDLRGTFATRLVERGIHQYVISALMGHILPTQGFGHESRITPGYAQATWESMVYAVESLEHPPMRGSVFHKQSGKSQANQPQDDTEEGIAKVG